MESFMKTLKVEGVCPLACEIAQDVAEHLPHFMDKPDTGRLHSGLGNLGPRQFAAHHTRPAVKTAV
jgi:putative transposase